MDILGNRDAIEKQYYYRAKDEMDAVAIEKLLGASLKGRFVNYLSKKNWKRTDNSW
nr:hypothetical protein [uncultured Desulfobacter sp.]